jgi:ubiquinone/menaquinone biosynthesis C-methylase UbiE
MRKPEPRPRICDYEGSNYRTEFWEGKDRDYEDKVERVALRRLLPGGGRRLLEIGAGFGRLTHEYSAFNQVVLVDYSLSQLQYAQEQLGRSDRYLYVAADAYKLPFRAGVFDAATMIRVIHHMADVPTVLAQVRRTMSDGGTFILEHANKQNLKAIIRYALNKQTWNPFDRAPVEFVELNFDFHPEYMQREMERAGFDIHRRLPVSFFRIGAVKNRFPTDLLVSMDSALQNTGLLVTPSIFIQSTARRNDTPNNLNADMIFASPETGAPVVQDGETMVCTATGQRWAIRNGIYDFKAPLEN